MVKKVYVVRVFGKGYDLGFISKVSYDSKECWEHIEYAKENSEYKEFLIEMHICKVVNEKNPNAYEDYDRYLKGYTRIFEKIEIKFETV